MLVAKCLYTPCIKLHMYIKMLLESQVCNTLAWHGTYLHAGLHVLCIILTRQMLTTSWGESEQVELHRIVFVHGQHG